MRVNKGKVAFFIIVIIVWIMVLALFVKMGADKKQKREEYLTESFSRLSKSQEVQDAYNSQYPIR